MGRGNRRSTQVVLSCPKPWWNIKIGENIKIIIANEDTLHLQVNIYKMYKQYSKHFQGTLETDTSHKTHTYLFVCISSCSSFFMWICNYTETESKEGNETVARNGFMLSDYPGENAICKWGGIINPLECGCWWCHYSPPHKK